jgi:hypothetical protein
MKMSRLKMLATGLVVLSAVTVADRALAQTTITAEEMRRRVEKVAPPYTTLPGKVLCSCPPNGTLTRTVGYLNSLVSDHGTYTTVDVWCVYYAFRPDGEPAFTTACADYRLLK